MDNNPPVDRTVSADLDVFSFPDLYPSVDIDIPSTKIVEGTTDLERSLINVIDEIESPGDHPLPNRELAEYYFPHFWQTGSFLRFARALICL